jgi:4-hydroxy-tetrahydrodipicolinate synthase
MKRSISGTPLRGVVPIIPTPFDAAGEIDEPALGRLIEFAVRCRVGAVCLPAYASEFYKLTEEERVRVVGIAVRAARDRVAVVAQSNHPSARIAATIARANVAEGAALVSVALPRQFAVPEADHLDYVAEVFGAVPVPCLLQDFNPAGLAVGAGFCVKLLKRVPNFRYIKLEEPLMAAKVVAIRQATRNRVGVLEGWGGMYMLDLIPAGICGVMPGLGVADVLQRAFLARKAGRSPQAFTLFESVLPQIVFSLQNMEFFHYAEKRLLVARGVLAHARTRGIRYTPDRIAVRYVDELNARVVRAAARLR